MSSDFFLLGHRAPVGCGSALDSAHLEKNWPGHEINVKEIKGAELWILPQNCTRQNLPRNAATCCNTPKCKVQLLGPKTRVAFPAISSWISMFWMGPVCLWKSACTPSLKSLWGWCKFFANWDWIFSEKLTAGIVFSRCLGWWKAGRETCHFVPIPEPVLSLEANICFLNRRCFSDHLAQFWNMFPLLPCGYHWSQSAQWMYSCLPSRISWEKSPRHCPLLPVLPFGILVTTAILVRPPSLWKRRTF